jgi:hypothetical protein
MPTSPWYPRLVFVKAAVSLISLAAVFLFLDVDAFVGYVERLGIGIVALNCLVLFAMCCALAWRWHLVLTVLEQRITGLALLIRAVTVGLFFNSVLPAGTAGDAIRILSVYRAGVPLKEAILSVLADRVIAFAVLIGLACLFVPLLAPELGTHVVAYLAAIGALATAGFAFLVFFRRMFLGRLRPEVVQKEDSLGRKLVAWFLRFMFATSAFFEQRVRRPALLATVLALIVVNQAGTTLIFHLTLDALGVATDYAQLFVLLTPAIVISLLPVSYGGWGTREIAIAFFLVPAGVDASAAVAASVVFGLANLLLGLLFLPAWLWEERAHRSREGEMQAGR